MAGSTVSAATIITDYQTCRIGDSPGLEVARTLQNLDWLLIAAYTLSLFSALCLLSLMTGLKPLGKNVLIFYLPPVIGGLDCLENVVMSILFDRFPDIIEWHVEVMTLAAFFKFALSTILLFALAYLFGCWLMDWSSRRGKTTDPQIQRTLDEVINAESIYLRFRREKAGIPEDGPPVGLSSSGGGIRSATVNLGVFEKLLDSDLMRRVDYHATVSGGGYIGSTLASLLSFKKKDNLIDITQAERAAAEEDNQSQYHYNPGDTPHFDCAKIDRRPFSLSGPGYSDDQPPFLSRWMVLNHLRSFGDFLVRRRRLLSRDVLRTVGTVLSGMTATLSMFALAALLCSSLAFVLLSLVDQGQESLKLGIGIASLGQYVQGFALSGCLRAFLCGAILLAILLTLHNWLAGTIKVQLFIRDGDTVDDCREHRGLWIIGTLLAISAFLIPHLFGGPMVGVMAPAAFLGGATMTAAAAYLLLSLSDDAFRFWSLPEEPSRLNRSLLSSMFGLALAYFCFAIILGFTPWLVGKLLNSGGVDLQDNGALETTGITGLLSAIITGLVAWYRAAGSISSTKDNYKKIARPLTKAYHSAKNLLLALPIIILVMIVLLISSTCVVWLVNHFTFAGQGGQAYLLLSCFLLLVVIFIGYTVDFNKLSLHYFYRDRLAEAYLTTYGPATNQPDSLEVKRDNIEMKLVDLHGSCKTLSTAPSHGKDAYITLHEYGPSQASHSFAGALSTALSSRVVTPELLNAMPIPKSVKQRMGLADDVRIKYLTNAATSAPYHLYCTCLNLTTDRNMLLRTRKSDIFIFSKLYCGSKTTSFVPTRSYRRGKTKVARAMTISGAALNSSLGRKTFFAQSFAATLFNLRLGQWLENPGYKNGSCAHKQEDLVFWPAYLLLEAFGVSDNRRRLIHLSDGGHTGDNLGIIPLIERRCELIVAVDAEADPDYDFGSLLTALNYLHIEGKVRIHLEVAPIIPDPKTGLSLSPFVLGEIEYLDLHKNVVAKGCLLLLKSAVTEEMSLQLRRHKERFPLFPQESTADQFFSEDQFEAYRILGRSIGDILLLALPSLADGKIDCDQLRREYTSWLEKLARLPKRIITRLPRRNEHPDRS
jgi:hypothetical protein